MSVNPSELKSDCEESFMANDAEKASAFLKNINFEADALCKQIRQETDRYVTTELNKARQRAHEDVKALRKSEFDRLNEETNAGFSEFEARETKSLLDRRAQITDEVFSKAKQRLIEFAQSEEYFEFLLKSIDKIKQTLGETSVIYLKPDDSKYEAELLKHCAEIKYTPEIEIGGCRAENTANQLFADDTLEARLEEEKLNFYKTSGLSITL